MHPDTCCFVVSKDYNANRGPTDKQPNETPLEKTLREDIVARVGPATSPQAGMADTMSKAKFPDV